MRACTLFVSLNLLAKRRACIPFVCATCFVQRASRSSKTTSKVHMHVHQRMSKEGRQKVKTNEACIKKTPRTHLVPESCALCMTHWKHMHFCCVLLCFVLCRLLRSGVQRSVTFFFVFRCSLFVSSLCACVVCFVLPHCCSLCCSLSLMFLCSLILVGHLS